MSQSSIVGKHHGRSMRRVSSSFSQINDDKVTVLESEKRAWQNSPEALAVREALNPWRHLDEKETKKS